MARETEGRENLLVELYFRVIFFSSPKTHREKGRLEVNKIALSCPKPKLMAEACKTAAVRPIPYQLSRTSQVRGKLYVVLPEK